jgi:hypothetical protein
VPTHRLAHPAHPTRSSARQALLAKKPSVSKAEFDAMIAKCPKTLDADMVGDLFSVFDKKGDGTISINELKVRACVCSGACMRSCTFVCNMCFVGVAFVHNTSVCFVGVVVNVTCATCARVFFRGRGGHALARIQGKKTLIPIERCGASWLFVHACVVRVCERARVKFQGYHSLTASDAHTHTPHGWCCTQAHLSDAMATGQLTEAELKQMTKGFVTKGQLEYKDFVKSL